MCHSDKTKYFGVVLIVMVLFFIFNPLNAQPGEAVSSEQKSDMIRSMETPSRILTNEIDPGGRLFPHIIAANRTTSSLENVLSILIVESQSINIGHNQDAEWLNMVDSMGHLGTITPQTTLDNSSFFSTTDILIISSGVIDIPTNRRNIIKQYIQQGGPVYIQGEYLTSYQTNQTFKEIVDSLGGSFTWIGTVSGDLIPMNVLGTLSNTPNNLTSLSYFWYGCAGSGDATIENYLEYGGQYFGFIFTPPNSNYGVVIANTDQDWARVGQERYQLMENIITYLSASIVTGIDAKESGASQGFALQQNYPNPFNPSTTISYSIIKSDNVSLKVYDILGREIRTLVNKFKTAGSYSVDFDAGNLPSGIYFYRLQSGKFKATKKMYLMQ